MRKPGLLLVVSAVACVLHATARPAAAQSPLDPSLPAYRAEEKLSGKLTLTGSFTSADNFSATSNLAFILDWEDPWEDCISCFFDPFPKTGRRL